MTTRLRIRILLAATLAMVAPTLNAPTVASAEPTAPAPTREQDAGTRFRKGLELYKDGDYQAALIEFRRAYELAPNYNVLYNIGQVYFQLQNYPNALTVLERYLAEGGSRVPASRRADVERDIEKLRARIGAVEIVSAAPDADVTVDDISVGKTPLAKPVLVSAGRHKITVTKGGRTTTKIVEVDGGGSVKIQLDPPSR